MAAIEPTLAIAAVILGGLFPLIVVSAWVRLTSVVGGALLVLGGASEVGASKIAYALILVLCGAVAVLELVRDRPDWLGYFGLALPTGVIFGVLTVATTMLRGDQPAGELVRQSLPYLFVILGPLVGLEAGRRLSHRAVLIAIGVIGIVAAVGFAVDWLSRRGVSALPLERVVLSSLAMSALGFSLALGGVVVSKGRERAFWWFVLIFVPASLLVTGTRTNLVLLAALAGAIRLTSWRRVIRIGVVLIMVITMLVPVLSRLAIEDPLFLRNRVSAGLQALRSGGEEDQSFLLRRQQYYEAKSGIAKHALLGGGFGFGSGQTFDTPLVIVAKVGVIGTTVLVLFLTSTLIGCRRLVRRFGSGAIHIGIRGTVLVLIASIPLGAPIEDKGFGPMLALAMAGISSFAADAIRTSTTSAPNRVPAERT